MRKLEFLSPVATYDLVSYVSSIRHHIIKNHHKLLYLEKRIDCNKLLYLELDARFRQSIINENLKKLIHSYIYLI